MIVPTPLRTSTRRATAAFTLLEVMASTTIFALAIGLTVVGYVAVLKRSYHTEDLLKGATELRLANDMIAQAVRSASQTPTVDSTGLKLIVPPSDLAYALVQDVTWIDQPNNVKGSKSNQRVLKVADYVPAAATASPWVSTTRPTGALASTDVATYFIGSSSLPTVNLSDLFSSGDTLTIPATAYGGQVSVVINSISNNSGTKTMTMTTSLGVDVPNGTHILATGGRRIQFEVTSTGDLRYYPDNRTLTQYSVIAHDIDPSPLSDPSNNSSATTLPFTISSRNVTINLQKVPKGTNAGRTVQGVLTTVYARTDSTVQ